MKIVIYVRRRRRWMKWMNEWLNEWMEWMFVAAADAARRRRASLWRLKPSIRCAAVHTATCGCRRAMTDDGWTWVSAVCPDVTQWWPPPRPDCADQAATSSMATVYSTTAPATSSTCEYTATPPVSLGGIICLTDDEDRTEPQARLSQCLSD